MHIDDCLEPYDVYGAATGRQPIELRFYPARATIDISKFFDEAFELRDRRLGLGSFPRTKVTEDYKAYYFTTVELAEAFCPMYSPQQVANYLNTHLTTNTMQSESLVRLIQDIPNNTRLVYVNYSRQYKQGFRKPKKGKKSDKKKVWLYSDGLNFSAVNFPLDELVQMAERSRFKGRIREYETKRDNDESKTWFAKTRPKLRLRRKGLSYAQVKQIFTDEVRPIALLCKQYYGLPDVLHDAYIAVRYNLPVNDLRLVRSEIRDEDAGC